MTLLKFPVSLCLGTLSIQTYPNPEVARIGIGSKVKFVPAFNATPAGTVAYLIFQARRMSSFQEFLYLCYWFQNTWDSSDFNFWTCGSVVAVLLVACSTAREEIQKHPERHGNRWLISYKLWDHTFGFRHTRVVIKQLHWRRASFRERGITVRVDEYRTVCHGHVFMTSTLLWWILLFEIYDIIWHVLWMSHGTWDFSVLKGAKSGFPSKVFPFTDLSGRLDPCSLWCDHTHLSHVICGSHPPKGFLLTSLICINLWLTTKLVSFYS